VQQTTAFCICEVLGMRMRRGDESLRWKLSRGDRVDGVSAQVPANRVSRCVVAPAVFGVEGSGVEATMGYART
jgi:hypothetical protein